MPNLSPRALLLAAGAACTALLASPLAQADTDTAYGDLAVIYSDAAAFSNSFGTSEDFLFDSDLAQDFFRATTGLAPGVDDPFGPDTTASDDLNTIVAESNTLTGQLDALETYQPASVVATTDFKELPVIGDSVAFQDQINTAIADLPAITAQDQTNPLLIADLGSLYGNELNLGTYLTNLGQELAAGSPAGITGDNAVILTEGLAILNDLNGTADTLTLLADLSSFGL